MDSNELAFSIIAEAGDAKSSAIEAAYAALERNFAEAETAMQHCEETLSAAHESQTAMIREEMLGNKQDASLLMIHAQDHLSGAILMREMSGIIVRLCQQMAQLEAGRQ